MRRTYESQRRHAARIERRRNLCAGALGLVFLGLFGFNMARTGIWAWNIAHQVPADEVRTPGTEATQ